MNIPLNIDWQQILLHLFNFIILGGGLYFLLFKPVKKFMDKRVKYYEDMDKAAKDKIAEAESTKAEFTRRLADAEGEIEAKRVAASKEIAEQNMREIAHATAEAEKIISDAKHGAEREYEKAIANAKKDIADMAMTAAEKIVYSSVSDSFDAFLNVAEENGEAQ